MEKQKYFGFIFTEYIDPGCHEELPLGEDFQRLVRCFTDPHEKKIAKKYAGANILKEQLAYVSFVFTEILTIVDLPSHLYLESNV